MLFRGMTQTLLRQIVRLGYGRETNLPICLHTNFPRIHRPHVACCYSSMFNATDRQRLWRRCFPQFCDSNDPVIENLMNSAQVITAPAKQTIFFPGARCQNYLLLIDGAISVQLLTDNGREVLLYQVRSGDSCILTTSCLLGGERYPVEGITEQEVTAFAIAANEFRQAIDTSPDFRQFVFNNFAKRLATVLARMEEIIFGHIDQRLAQILLDANVSPVRKTHHQLASELGTAREVVSRHLKRFEAYSWIRLGRGEIVLHDLNALKRLTNDA